MSKITRETIRSRLEVCRAGGEQRVFYDGHDIGRIVRYGKPVGFSRSKVKTAYGSRIYGSDATGRLKIEEEASSEHAVLDKVSASLARHLKARKAQTSVHVTEEDDASPVSPAP